MSPAVGLLCVLLCCYSAPYSSAFFLLGGLELVAPVFPLPEGPLVGDSGLGGPGSLGPAFGKTSTGPGCSWILEQNFQKKLKAQKEAGIEHFRSNLSPELLFREDSEALSCVQSLLMSVTRADLQPVMFVDLSLVSDGQEVQTRPGPHPGPGQGPGPDPGLLQRLDLIFAELGGLVHTWVVLMDDMKDDMKLYSDVHRIFRRHFTDDDHRLSLGLTSSDLSYEPEIQSDLPIDFLSLKLLHDCSLESGFETELAHIQRVSGLWPVLIYSIELKHCSDKSQLMGNVLRAQIQSQLDLVGFDVTSILELEEEEEEEEEEEGDKEELRFSAHSPPSLRAPLPPSLRAPLPPSSVPSASSSVWQSFSPRTEFQTKKFHYSSFPADFLWGVQSSAYQVEGGWDAHGKGASVWDTFTQRNSSGIPEKATGNVACDSYNRLDQDLDLIQASGVSAYSFSLSWARLFPSGDGDHNPAGVQYYNSLVDGLLRLKVVPVVSLHHWDLPQSLQDHGGWRNRSMVHLFTRYADFCYRTFGDRVKLWITINDPLSLAWRGYGTGEFPPGVKDPGVAPYHVAHTLLLAHAGAYHAYTPYRESQGGSVSIALRGDWYEPLDLTVPRELEAADRAMQFTLGWFAHPIFRNGDYPEAMKEAVGNKSELQRLKETRLPVFSEQEMLQVHGSADVFCLIHQTTRIAKYSTQRLKPPSYLFDRDLNEAELTDYPQTEVPGQRAVSWGLRRVLAWVRDEYGDPEVYVTENGVSTKRDVGDEDTERVFFIQTYINEALKAQSLDGVRLRGYLGAPLMDSFEWLKGYIAGQGLHQVDFTKPERPRTMRTSAYAYRTIVQNNGFPPGRDQTPIYGFFREDMMWSTATASYQIEGAWRADGKGLSIWDTFAHTPLRVSDDDTGDVACDSYHRYEEDVQMLKELGVGFYRFSIAWSRVLPDGTTAHVNEPGLQYYERLVDALLREGIQPQVTLYHWDLPQSLQDVGGWENVTVVQRFTEYADLMFLRLGDKVKFWITINEPYIISNVGHGYGAAAPGISFRPGTLPYIVGHHLLKSHAEAWHLYDQKYRPTQKGQISITLNSDWAEPRNPTKQEDHDAARRMVEFQLGWFAHPVFVGDYSPLMKTIIGNRSLAAGLPKSRLPEFTPEEIIRIRGTHDYFGFNHYTTKLAYPLEYGNLQHYDGDRSAGTLVDRAWLDSGSGWLKVTPFGFRRILNFIKENYGDPPLVVTENGVSQRDFNMNDELRQHYYQEYTNQLLKAYLEDKVDIRGYTAWSLMDNLEWATGFAEQFGLYHVNRTDPDLKRTPKASVQTYNQIIRCNGFPHPDSGHKCLQPKPNVTVAPPTDPSLNFLGLTLTPEQAEVGFHTTFALLVVSCVAALVAAVCYCRRKLRGKTFSNQSVIMK